MARFELYKFWVVPFGLTNAPATFNQMMDRIFHPHRKFTRVFFDDLLASFSQDEEEHQKHLQIIFEKLGKHKLQINFKKSEFSLKDTLLGPYSLSQSSENAPG